MQGCHAHASVGMAPVNKSFRNRNMAERSAYQQRVIRDYYQNQEAILVQRLGEMVTDLFLSEGKARERLWERVAATLEKLKVPPKQVRHIVQSDNPTLLANLLKQLLDRK